VSSAAGWPIGDEKPADAGRGIEIRVEVQKFVVRDAVAKATEAVGEGAKVEDADSRTARTPLVTVDQYFTLLLECLFNKGEGSIHDLFRDVFRIIRIDEV